MNLLVSGGQQTLLLLYSVLFGVLCAALYQVFALIDIVLGKGVLITFVLDMLYWAVLTLATFSFFMAYTQGSIRVFVLISQGAGAALYFFTAGKLMERLFGWLWRMFRKFFGPVYKFICIYIEKWVKFCKKIAKIAVAPLQRYKALVYTVFTKTIPAKGNKIDEKAKKRKKTRHS